jgi:uncharacterized protein (TIGR00730 family)
MYSKRVVVISIVIIIFLILLFIERRDNIKGITVFGSSSDSVDTEYFEFAKKVGEILGKRTIIFSGGKTGLISRVAGTVIENGGKVIGVTTKLYSGLDGLKEGMYHYYIENDLRRRKERFEELSNSILILPGGFGTLDEMIEMITRKIWEDLSIPIIIFNYNGYFNELLNMFENIQMNKFGKDYKEYIMIVNDFDELNNILQKLKL